MSDMKCPFCDNELERVYSRPFQLICVKCGSLGTDELWQELIRTRKALEIALDAIDKGEAALIGCQEADDKYISDVTAEDGLELMSKAYKQITALEQKEQ